ncbi:PP2C family protein-serine/threonine phosphatase [Klebsiella pneumoniae]|uniref:PP2C family protein-serine/threonine phosphatase n=1 Tax=Klebsiella pneumoniae complex TaxID=3390273 RepID=UPI0007CC6F7F|nr:protein phosphatase 2C domain-containing protein [Klebsiella variicola]SAT40450.1 Serine/threonine phosphatase stp [Klebsiella variicola]
MIELISCGAFSCPKGNDRENQDALLLPQQCDDGFIFAVADGVGSYAGAKEAAQTAVNHVAIHKSVAAFEPNEILKGIKEKISDLSLHESERRKAATTLSYCVVAGGALNVIHVGDTRVYLKVDNKLKLLTKDHTQHQELLDDGLYTKKELTELPGKNLLTAAISKVLPVKFQHVTLPLNEVMDHEGIVTLILMSDGAHHFWERRPRFSPNTLKNANSFSANLLKRIQRNGPTDDHSLVAVNLKIS